MAILVAKIVFDCGHPDKVEVFTNATPEVLQKMLADFVSDQTGRGEDRRPVPEKAKFSVEISLNPKDNSFKLKTDAGNRVFACGIVIYVAGLLGAGELAPKPLGATAG
ncbi:MAG: hypothetical protein M1586_01000 [Patescibacteria group bacterium]|nr:hypothetical protein [Patescibacteria group bacterium]MCL5261864.1 hypothetical protein [Patescibacteria group bacterium]